MSGVTEFSIAMTITLLIVGAPIVGVCLYGLIRASVWLCERWWP